MTDTIIEFFRQLFHNDIATIIVISMIPIIELRGAIPVAISMEMSALSAFWWAWLGSSLVAPILLLILKPILKWMKSVRFFRGLADAVEGGFKSKADKVLEGTDGKSAKQRERKKLLGTFCFVAVPVPLTGVWTGSAVAAFLDLPFWKGLLTVIAGNAVAGGIVTALAYFLKDYMDLILTVFLGIVVVVLVFYIVTLVLRMIRNKKGKEAEIAESDAQASDGTEEDARADESQSDETKVEPRETALSSEEMPERTAKRKNGGESDNDRDGRVLIAVPREGEDASADREKARTDCKGESHDD